MERVAATNGTTRRILTFLAREAAVASAAVRPGTLLLTNADGAVVSATRDDIGMLVCSGWVIADGDRFAITARGRRHLAASQGPADALGARPVEIEARVLRTGDGIQPVMINATESPLAQLVRRRDRKGRPFLSAREFEAGERLRADYERGCIAPRLGMNWSSMGLPATGARTDAIVDLGDAALGARQRVEAAIEAVGPEFAGLLVDICCFLKGLERVEAERGWPVRSAKVLLKAALAALDRHYRPNETRRSTGQRAILHWGSADFRPSVSG